MIKYDTVVVHSSGVGIEKFEVLSSEFKVYPQPADEVLSFECSVLNEDLLTIKLYNNLSQLVREEEINFVNKKCSLNVSKLPPGVYTLNILTKENYSINKRIVISR